ncbi:HAMP domain-containing sensor histidine kinase [Tepidibacter hydrothermalis]|uniref:histidine kinase n=1 Tax=Tepidibacter hydrothermalis TaxID=3036126 RepID=A0ABY8EF57_9FIRM|nr:HAMP domain-containing sensor histidine kinase [Tepidibacter hydrothermalis]WFD10219.1 HAMP domain-containing sensor histidine kinase [Tepidibacter hydrothermalis]
MKATNKKSYFNILVRDFLRFVVVVLVLIFIILLIREETVDISMRKYLESTYEYVPSSILNGEYSKLKSDKKLGSKGFFEILNEKNEVIYIDPKHEPIEFTFEELALIPNENNRPIITKEEYREFDSKRYTQLTFEYYEKLKKTYQTVVVVDENLKLNFSDIPDMIQEFTQDEFDLLSGVYNDSYEVSKLSFIDNEGDSYSVVFFREYSPLNVISTSLEGTLAYSLFAFIVFFIAAALVYLINLDKKVKVPLLLLSEAIDEFSHGKREKLITYKGPHEFERVCKEFNAMAIKLNEAEKKQFEIEEEKKKIIADISHDLKTPITVIQGFAKALIDKKIDETDSMKYLECIYNKSHSMSELISAFSEYSKLDRPDFKLDDVSGNISEFIRAYFIDKFDELELLGYKLDIEIAEREIYLKYDCFQMKRVLDNIISNTTKYSPKGTTIYFRLKESNKEISIMIGDNGPGISKELQKMIFDPFVVGNDSRTTASGSGLGMAIVDKIIKSHNGTIEFVSGKSSKMTVLYEIKIPK